MSSTTGSADDAFSSQGWGDDSAASQSWDSTWSNALAGFWIRFLSTFVDGIIIGIIAVPFGGVAAVTGDASTGAAAAAAVQSSGVQTLIQVIYFTYFHASAAGQSIGNRVTNIRVADLATGQPLPWSRALVRVLMSIVSSIPLGLGYFWMLWDANNQTWHDKVANSVVVKTALSPAPGPFGRPPSSS